MKILYIHQYFSTPKGSVGTRSYEFGKRLVAEGHEVTILCGNYHLTDVPAEVDGMRVIQIPVASSNRDPFAKRVFSFLNFSLRATWYALRLKYDLVYATSTPLTVGVPALAAKWLRRKRFIFEVRDLWPELPRAMGIIRNGVALGFLEWFETRCYRSADACVGLAPGIVEGIEKKAPGKRVELIPNGCDLEMFGVNKVESGKREEETKREEEAAAENLRMNAFPFEAVPLSNFPLPLCLPFSAGLMEGPMVSTRFWMPRPN